MRVVGCVNAYQDVALLRQTLPLVRAQVDHLIVVDGPYSGFPPYPGAEDFSSDGTIECAREYADEVVQHVYGNTTRSYAPWGSEIIKRNAYLQYGRAGDYFLVIDADEEIEGALDRKAMAEHSDWLLDLYDSEEPRFRQPIHRCFAWRPGIEYKGTHHAVHVDGRLIQPDPLPILSGIRLRHLTRKRPDERNAKKEQYYKKLNVMEHTFRVQHGL